MTSVQKMNKRESIALMRSNSPAKTADFSLLAGPRDYFERQERQFFKLFEFFFAIRPSMDEISRLNFCKNFFSFGFYLFCYSDF